MKQRDIFLSGEGDSWYNRNIGKEKHYAPETDPISCQILKLMGNLPTRAKVLEIGCGMGSRLVWMKNELGLDVYGVDPSAQAVSKATGMGVKAQVGTAEQLLYESDVFDILIFGFCLYLCDREDLFQIAAEADRVTKKCAWIVIHDFFSKEFRSIKYHHHPSIRTFKMDHSQLFSWHPAYSSYSSQISHHSNGNYTDDRGEWVGVSVVRKYPILVTTI